MRRIMPPALARILARKTEPIDSASALEKWPDDPSQRIQAAATRRLVHFPLDVLAHGIGISSLTLTDPAGTRHRVGKNASKKGTTAVDLVNATLRRAIDPDRPGSTGDVLEWGVDALNEGIPAVELIYDVIEMGYFGFMAPEPHALVLQTYAWLAAHQDQDLADAFNTLNERLVGQVEAGLAAMLEREGRHPVKGVTVRDLAVIMIGLVEGVMVQHRFAQDSADGELLGASVAAAFAGLTQPIDAEHEDARTRTTRIWEQ